CILQLDKKVIVYILLCIVHWIEYAFEITLAGFAIGSITIYVSDNRHHIDLVYPHYRVDINLVGIFCSAIDSVCQVLDTTGIKGGPYPAHLIVVFSMSTTIVGCIP